MFRLVFQHPYLGREFDWIAADKFGRLGYFSTAGAGPIPQKLHHEVELGDIFETIIALDVNCSVVVAGQHEGSMGDWIEAAKRGLFAFDWDLKASRYSLVAKPNKCLFVSDLNLNLRSKVSKIILDIDFRDEHLGAGLW